MQTMRSRKFATVERCFRFMLQMLRDGIPFDEARRRAGLKPAQVVNRVALMRSEISRLTAEIKMLDQQS